MVARLHESDFQLHSRYQMGVDWPISYRELEPYDSRAEEIMGVAGSKVHGVQNLYVVGSSVFPTSDAGWPTLTVAALALRLADHLRSRL
jgi:choline dehydrogenase-like flavoprotein